VCKNKIENAATKRSPVSCGISTFDIQWFRSGTMFSSRKTPAALKRYRSGAENQNEILRLARRKEATAAAHSNKIHLLKSFGPNDAASVMLNVVTKEVLDC
jgi:hypothetical protein